MMRSIDVATVMVVVVGMARAAAAEPCADAMTSETRDHDRDELCLAHDARLVVTGGVGFGTVSADGKADSPWSGYATIDAAAGPVRVSLRGTIAWASSIDALVGLRVGYHYGPAEISWSTSHYVGSSGRYDYYAVQSHATASLVRAETVLVAGVRGTEVPSGGADVKTLEVGVQRFNASGFGTHRRVELRALVRGEHLGGVFVYDNAIPSFAHVVEGLEVSYAPYADDMPSRVVDEVTVMFRLGWSLEW